MKPNSLIQGSAEWLAWRKEGIGGSDAPAIMGVSPWMTAYDLWELKTGKCQPQESNFAMSRGVRLEPIARAAYEKEIGNIMEPACLTHPMIEWMRASLDGITFDGSVALEIKCPGKDDHASAKAGKVPDKYIPQVQHVLAVSGASVLHYWSYDGEQGVLVVVPRDDLYINCLVEEEQRFWQAVCTDSAPLGAPRDDKDWLALAKHYRELKREQDALEWAITETRDKLIVLGGGYGGGLTCQQVSKKGNVDYKAIPELEGVDLEPYRKAGRKEWRITVEKDK